MTPTENSATSLGGHLRALREARGGSLEDMARSTRVGIRHLEALEEERLADLPSPVFVRGFIRAYCGFLREGPEEALAFYEALAGERAAMQAASAPPRPRTTWAPSSVLVGLVLLVILAIALIVVNLTVKRTGGDFSRSTGNGRVGRDADRPRRPRRRPPRSRCTSRPHGPLQPPLHAPPAPAAAPPVSTPAAMPAPTPAPAVARNAAGPQRLVIRAVERNLDSRPTRRGPGHRGAAARRRQPGVVRRAPLPRDHRQCRRRRGRPERQGPAAARPERDGDPAARAAPGTGLRLVSLFGSLGERVRQGLRRTRELMDEGLGASSPSPVRWTRRCWRSSRRP